MADDRRDGAGGAPVGEPASGSSWRSVLVSYRWPLAVVALGLVALAFYLVTVHQARQAATEMGELIGAAADRAESAARNFLTADVTELFIASIPEIATGGSGRLELATAEFTETFTRTDERRILWDSLSLGTTVTEIKVPVTYRYHVRLDDPWRLEVSGQTCVVYAPPIRPSQPPAIHTQAMERRADESWLRFDAEEQLDALQRSITPKLIARARDPRHLALVREPGRKAVAEFVRAWLLREDQWRSDRFYAIKVVFPDEEVEDAGRLDVTILLEDG